MGLGATGRSTGIIGPGLSMPMRSLRRRYCDAVAAEAFASTLDGTAEIGRLISAEAIDCDARLEHQVVGALTERQERRMHRHTFDLAELGFGVPLVGPELAGRRLGGAYRAAFAYENVLLVDPYRLVTGLAAAAERRGVRIAERTRVTRLETRPDGVRAHTPGGMIDADRVLLAVDGYGEGLNPHPSSVVPVRMHAVATAPLTPDQRAALGWDGVGGVIDQRNFFNYYRLGAGGRLVFGGGRPGCPAATRSGKPAPRRGLRPGRRGAAPSVPGAHRRGDRGPLVRSDRRDARPAPRGRRGAVTTSGCTSPAGWCGHGLSLCVSTAQRYARVLAEGRSPGSGRGCRGSGPGRRPARSGAVHGAAGLPARAGPAGPVRREIADRRRHAVNSRGRGNRGRTRVAATGADRAA